MKQIKEHQRVKVVFNDSSMQDMFEMRMRPFNELALSLERKVYN